MSAGPMNPNPYSTPQFGGTPGESPELMSKASTAFTMGIAGMIVGFCCCGPIGFVLGILSFNGANGVLAAAPPGSQAHSKASTAKILGIVAMAIGGIVGLLQVVSIILNLMGAMLQH